MRLINDEIHKYDLDALKNDTLHQVHTIANNLTKSERQLVQDESRHLRYLARVSHMQRALLEDSEHVKSSLRHTERLKERAQRNFEVIDQENLEETRGVE